MSGVSIGWFEPGSCVQGLHAFVTKACLAIGPAEIAWPIVVKGIQDTTLSYCKVDGHIPIHIDPGVQEPFTSMFHFVFMAVNRPVLLVGEAADPRIGPAALAEQFDGDPARCTDAMHRSKRLLTGADKSELNTFTMGALELVPGMAVHFDIARTWHGISQAPVPMDANHRRQDPQLLIIQMGGYRAGQIGEAAEDMAKLLFLDRGYWNRPTLSVVDE